jgi:hypothetical protein
MVDGLCILMQNKTKKPLAIALSGVGRASRRRDSGGDVTMYNISLFGIVTINPVCTMNIY